ncbi:ead/Ea22-like family protein [Salmonella enterica]|nr:ead/Ea22-like family protein [Salmonella enterica]
MSYIDKQALREELSNPAIGSKDHLRKPALSLLDELDVKEEQRANWFQMAQKLGEDLDAAERHIAETNRLNAELTAKIELMDRRIAELERSETQLINERDSAESALNDAYKAVMGQAPEWSNWFSFENAIEEMDLACELWRNQTDDAIQFRQRIKELEARTVNLSKRSVGEVMHLSGFSRDYAEGWCAGNDNAIHEIRTAGIKVKEE